MRRRREKDLSSLSSLDRLLPFCSLSLFHDIEMVGEERMMFSRRRECDESSWLSMSWWEALRAWHSDNQKWNTVDDDDSIDQEMMSSSQDVVDSLECIPRIPQLFLWSGNPFKVTEKQSFGPLLDMIIIINSSVFRDNVINAFVSLLSPSFNATLCLRSHYFNHYWNYCPKDTMSKWRKLHENQTNKKRKTINKRIWLPHCQSNESQDKEKTLISKETTGKETQRGFSTKYSLQSDHSWADGSWIFSSMMLFLKKKTPKGKW